MPDNKSRDRSPRNRRGNNAGASRGGNTGGGNSGGNRRGAPPEKRVFVSNIPFEMKWQEVKDMFKEHVGPVAFVQLYNDENDKPRGCGMLEFDSQDMAKKAIEVMHRYDLNGRKLVVKEDFDNERDKFGRIIRGGQKSENRDRDRGGSSSDNRRSGPSRNRGNSESRNRGDLGDTYGLSPQFLESLGIDGPLHNRIFAVNLAFEVDERKLVQVFRLAGRVVSAELNRDRDGKSRGHAVIEYSHPVEAVQAISMLNDQMLMGRKMTVRFDKDPGPSQEELDQLPNRLPEGLTSVGMGLGSGGNPLTNVAANLPSARSNTNNISGNVDNVSNLAELASTVGNIQAVLAQTMGMNNLNNVSLGGGSISGGSGNLNNMGSTNMPQAGTGGLMGSAPLMPNNMGGNMANMNNGNSMAGGSNITSFRMDNTGSSNSTIGYSTGNSSNFGSMQANNSSLSDNVGGKDGIIVRNLPMNMTWQTLREGFSQYGDVKFADMRERGVGYVRFSNEQEAQRAVSMMDKQMVEGRSLDVQLY